MKMDVLSELSNFFPAAVYTGLKLVMLSPNHEAVIRRAENESEFQTAESRNRVVVEILSGSEDTGKKLVERELFQIRDVRKLAGEIEKYIENALDISMKCEGGENSDGGQA
ncbi:hypothetical protein L21SP3_00169 [Sedimentisphaera cyanobacteriorum]|uniref:Uncharacterized protein n=1 Tax=Sedimentisphaera cyanobacteriorum TaxID=1940790 RepID=A0A1Q2HMD0_9BACT|nr:hypothetical protein [Sedimentisphaera cyanobacteriorum]AQQ08393.1 hypothetical protein L21SP3_00169 [Sedimentisphaera cyanobacteriorum]